MSFPSKVLLWVIAALLIVRPINSQFLCPENQLSCLNNVGNEECFSGTQLCVDVAPENCSQLGFSGLTVQCKQTNVLNFS